MKTPVRLVISGTVFVLLVACITTTLAPTARATPSAAAATSTPAIVPTNSTAAMPVQSQPMQVRGITAVNNFEPSAQGGSLFDGKLFDAQTFTNPSVAGITFRTSWEDVEPTQDGFDWNKLDTTFDDAD